MKYFPVSAIVRCTATWLGANLAPCDTTEITQLSNSYQLSNAIVLGLSVVWKEVIIILELTKIKVWLAASATLCWLLKKLIKPTWKPLLGWQQD